jgi:hypothetical protein
MESVPTSTWTESGRTPVLTKSSSSRLWTTPSVALARGFDRTPCVSKGRFGLRLPAAWRTLPFSRASTGGPQSLLAVPSAVRIVVRRDHRCRHSASSLDLHPLVTSPRPHYVSLAKRSNVRLSRIARCPRPAGRCPLRQRPRRRSRLRCSWPHGKLLGGALLCRRCSCRSRCALRRSILNGSSRNAFLRVRLICQTLGHRRRGGHIVSCSCSSCRTAFTPGTDGPASRFRFFRCALCGSQVLLESEGELNDRDSLLQRVMTRVNHYLHLWLLTFTCTWTPAAAARVESRPTTRIGERCPSLFIQGRARDQRYDPAFRSHSGIAHIRARCVRRSG